MRTRIDIASCAAGPWPPSSIAWSRGERDSICPFTIIPTCERLDAVGPESSVAAAGARVVDLPGTTLTPGLVEAHSHILLHAYSETSWTDQVSREGLALRVARATNHLRSTLMAGFTTVRDLGTEGAGYA